MFVQNPPPSWIKWSDNSDMAVGGFVAKLVGPRNKGAKMLITGF